MMRRMLWGALVALATLGAGPANAAGLLVGLGLGGLGAAVTAATTWLTTTFVGRLIGSVILSALQAKLARRKQRTPGLRTRVPGTGGLNPRGFILGTFATAGTRAAPDNSYGTVDDTPNAWLVQVVVLCDIPGAQHLRCAVDGAWRTLEAAAYDAWGGRTYVGDLAGSAALHLWSGHPTNAPGYLMSAFGAAPVRPWQSDMRGEDMLTAISSFFYKPSLFNGIPAVRHEVAGIPLYDPRKDSTAGGVGAHRWTDRATWEYSANPALQIYNVLRGIEVPDLGTWGGLVDGADLPVAGYVAGANAADVTTPRPGGGSEPRFRAHAEVKVTDEPHEVLADLQAACNGQLADCGGYWKLRVGEPGLPVYFFDDGDCLVSAAEDLDPFPSADATYNAIKAIYAEPAALYEPTETGIIANEDWQAEDGQERVAELELAACTSPTQAQRVMSAELNAQRRWRTHRVPLPPDAAVLEPLDTVSWTSARNGYVAKLFEVTEVEDQPETMIQIVSLREVDPADSIFDNGKAKPVYAAPPPPDPVAPQVPAGVALSVRVASTAAGDRRKRILSLAWTPAAGDGKGLEYEVRRQGETALLCSGAVLDAGLGQAAIPAEPLPGATFEARARFRSIQPQAWSGWVTCAVPAARTIGAPSLTALAVAKTVTNALTAFDAVATVTVTGTAFTGQEAGFAKLQASLTGAATARLVWRQILRETGGAGGSYVTFERIEELTSGRTLVISGGGSASAPWANFTVTTEVSGELLPAGATVTITHCANQFITPHA